MDECEGTTIYNSAPTFNDTPPGNNGTLTIGASGEDTVGTCATSSTAWGSGATGMRNASISFDGTDDYVSTPITTAYSALTVTAWVKTTDSSYSRDGTGIQNILGKWVSGNKSFDFRMQSGVLFVGISPGADSNGEGEESTFTISSDQWTHVAFTYDDSANTVVIYKNGVGQTFTNSVTMGGTPALQIGRLGWGGVTDRNWNGQIDDVKIFNYALTPQQIKTEYNSGSVRFE
jgi:hypothetical protein